MELKYDNMSYVICILTLTANLKTSVVINGPQRSHFTSDLIYSFADSANQQDTTVYVFTNLPHTNTSAKGMSQVA